MQFTGEKGFALIVHAGIAEIVRYRHDPGGTYMIMDGRVSPFEVYTDFEDGPQVYIGGNSRGITDVVHVVAVADRREALPAPETVTLPSAAELAMFAPELDRAITQSHMSSQLKDHLRGMLTERNRVATVYSEFTRMGSASDAMKSVISEAANEESAIFGGMRETIDQTIAAIVNARPAENADRFADRVQAAANPRAPAAPAQQPAAMEADIDPEEIRRQCKQELDELLIATRERISQIDRRLIDAGVRVGWRDAMNEVFDAAMQASRTLDYGDDDAVPRGPRRR